MPRQLAPTASPKTSQRPKPGDAGDHGDRGDERRGPGAGDQRRAGRPGGHGAPPPAHVGRRRPPAQRVELAQPGRRLDDLGEADLLAGQGERDERRRAREPAARPGRPRAAATPSSAPSGVGAGVAEHRALAQVLRQQRRGPAPSAAAATAAGPARPAQGRARCGQAPALSARPGRRSSRLTRLAHAGDDARRRAGRVGPRGVRPRLSSAAAASPAVADAGDLDQPGGDPPRARARRGGRAGPCRRRCPARSS